jgi:hypothetical protein
MGSTTKVFPAVLIALMSACGGGGDGGSSDTDPGNRLVGRDDSHDAGPGDVLVYRSRQSVQCGSRGLTPAQSAQRLIDGGIDVIKSGCGSLTGVFVPAVCGGDTGDILIHEIRRENLPDAEKLGFGSAATLIKPATGEGYAWVDCETRQPLP